MPAINKLIVGQEIVRLDLDRLPTSKRSFDPILHLINGVQLRFVVRELEPGTYGVMLKTIKPERKRRRKS